MRTFFRLGHAATIALSIAVTTPAAKAETLDVWIDLDPTADNVRAKTMAHMLERFEELNPDIDLNVTVYPYDQIPPQLLRADKAGSVPDVVEIYSPLVQTNIQAGNLLSLEPYLDAWPAEKRDDIVTLNAAVYDGDIYALPLELRVFGLLYNAKALADSGVAVPTNLAELAEASRQMNEEGWIGLAFGFNPADAAGSIEWFIPTLAGMGAKILNEDGTAAFDSPQSRKLVQYVHDLVHKDGALAMDIALSGDEAIAQLGESGRVIFIRLGTHRVAFSREKTGLGTDLQFMPFPAFETGKRSPALIQGKTLAIPAKSDAPDAAWKFIEHWTSPEIQQYQTEQAGYLPVLKSVSGLDTFDTPDRQYVRDSIAWASEDSLNFNWPAKTDLLISVLARMFEQVLTDRMTVEEGLQWAENEYNRRIKS